MFSVRKRDDSFDDSPILCRRDSKFHKQSFQRVPFSTTLSSKGACLHFRLIRHALSILVGRTCAQMIRQRRSFRQLSANLVHVARLFSELLSRIFLPGSFQWSLFDQVTVRFAFVISLTACAAVVAVRDRTAVISFRERSAFA